MSRAIGRTNELSLQRLIEIFAVISEVKLAVLFGSRAGEDFDPRSDYDIAVLMERSEGGLDDPFYALYADLPIRMKVQECDLDLIDLRKADFLLKQSIKKNYKIIKGPEDEISRLLAENERDCND